MSSATTTNTNVTSPESPLKRAKSTNPPTHPSNNNNTSEGAPIYITIGPQCAGKTTLLSTLTSTEHGTVKDVTIDDQEGVYLKIPTSYFLTNSPPPPPPTTTTTNKEENFLEKRILGKSLAQRIYDSSNDEMRFVLQRLHNVMNATTFQTLLLQDKTRELKVLIQEEKDAEEEQKRIMEEEEEQKRIMEQEQLKKQETENEEEEGWNTVQTPKRYPKKSTSNNNNNNNHQRKKRQTEIQKLKLELSSLNHLIATVEKISILLSHSPPTTTLLPTEVDLFIQEAIFRPRFPPLCNTSALDAAIQTLNNVQLQNKPIAWGNTNTRPREYKSALQAAQSLNRPVYFIMYDSSSILLDEQQHQSLVLNQRNMETLVERNVYRLIQTGKYVPCKAILDATLRCENLKDIVWKELERLYPLPPTHNNDDGGNGDDDGGDVIEYVGKNERKYTKIQLDVALANLANFEMDAATRCVVHVPPPTITSSSNRERGDGGGGRGRDSGGGGYSNNGETRWKNDRGSRGENGKRCNNKDGSNGRGGAGRGGGRYYNDDTNNGAKRYNGNGRRYDNGNERRYGNGNRYKDGQPRYNDDDDDDGRYYNYNENKSQRYPDSAKEGGQRFNGNHGRGGGGRYAGNSGQRRYNGSGGRYWEDNGGRQGQRNRGGANTGRGSGRAYNQNSGDRNYNGGAAHGNEWRRQEGDGDQQEQHQK